MPVILDNGSDAIRTWLDPTRTEWSNELQCLLKPYEGELECYPVSKDVGKVGNNSPSFLIPINSTANPNNIANFFGNQRKSAKSQGEEQTASKAEEDAKDSTDGMGELQVQHDVKETRATTDSVQGSEDNAPLPVPPTSASRDTEEPKGIKREHSDAEHDGKTPAKKQRVRSATSNGSATKTPKSDGSQRITSFFGSK